ncbi:tyrosyl-tRNA synthetase [Strigomonas culicis]|uniref:Aminoacyl tRNA synthase complex-interacting multifunctional protein 1 n=1 Tax=Strigomonas culicis TaxID=28005 RepID=S9U8W4_9TRYP|nr:aminoacyl tRNA synthase complex-interacting multifunctional protein 1 [Strigomonas culicis]EPY27182.1 tyrosyl-tRNA synthetase [Strigomonas culicis]|eukprot:EPY19711.1 aminoacyl tRNA synthase complex-interacting multifunctional protein 1 [Strigomonas culicis]
MQYLIESSSPLAAAVAYALEHVLSVPASSLVQPSDAFGVRCEGATHYGVVPVLQALRKAATTAEQQAFLGAPGSLTAAYVNQWANTAALLSADASYLQRSPATYQSLAKSIYADVDAMIDGGESRVGFLAATPRATVADVLLYAALHNHPEHAQVGAVAMAWSVAAQTDPYLASIVSPHVHASGAKKVQAAAAAAVTYVKPSEEEIQRRRAEKEKAKAEKEKAKAAAGQGSSAGPAKAAAKAAAGHTKGAKEEDVASLEVRVGRFANVRPHPEADRLYVEDMLLQDGARRTIVSGLVDHYPVDQLNDTLCLVVCNMKPKPLKGVMSEGMVVCACTDTDVRLVRPPAGAQQGDRIVFGTATADDAAPAVLSGHKMTELLSHLHTDADGTVCWKELKATHKGTPVAIPEMKNCTVR